MRRPALTRLAVVPVAALSLALAAAAPGLADSHAETPPSVTDDGAPAGRTAPVLGAEEPVENSTETPDVETPEGETPEGETPEGEAPEAELDAGAEFEADDEVNDEETSPSAAAGGKGAYSYPFVLAVAEDGTSTVTIEVAGAGISLSYVLDEAGKVTEAAVAEGGATLVRATPHTVRLLLASGETVTVKVHGDSVRVKVKPRKGGPLRPGITTDEEAESDEAAETETETADEEGDEEAKPAKPAKADKADKSSKPARGEKSQKSQKRQKAEKSQKAKADRADSHSDDSDDDD